DHLDFCRRSPRLLVDFRERLEFDEAAWFPVKDHGLLVLAFAERTLLHRLSEILAIVAQIKLVFLDAAIHLIVLSRKVGESLDARRRPEFEDDLMRMRRAAVLPLSVPDRGGIAIHGIGALAVFAGRFLAIHAD